MAGGGGRGQGCSARAGMAHHLCTPMCRGCGGSGGGGGVGAGGACWLLAQVPRTPLPVCGRELAESTWPSLAMETLAPWRQLLAAAESLGSPLLERITAPVRVPRWLLDDLLCEVTETVVADAVTAVQTIEVPLSPEGPLWPQARPYEAHRRCTEPANAVAPQAGPAVEQAAASVSPRPGQRPAYVVAGGLWSGSSAIGPADDSGEGASVRRFVLVEVHPTSVALVAYNLPRAKLEPMLAAFAQTVRPRLCTRVSIRLSLLMRAPHFSTACAARRWSGLG